MNNVFWTYKELEDSKVAVMILSPNDESCRCFSVSEDNENPYIICSSVEEAKIYATEINKPNYYKEFKSNYEITYYDCDSYEWYKIFEIWVEFFDRMTVIREKWNTPFYKVIWDKIVKIFK